MWTRKKIGQILDDYETIREKVSFDRDEITHALISIINDYKNNIYKPEVKEIYINISKDIINKEINLFIKFQKKLILNNELIIDIYKYLINLIIFFLFINIFNNIANFFFSIINNR